MKIAHVMRRFTPAKWGGTETVVFNTCQELSKKGVSNVIFCTDMFSQSGQEVIEGVPVRRFSYTFPWIGLSDDAQAKMRLKGGSPLSFSLFLSLLREPNLSLIHTHVQHRLGGIARTVARLRRIPYVVSVHGGVFTMPAEHAAKMQEPFKNNWEWGKVFGWLLGARRTLQDADAIICVGQDEYEEMKKRFPSKKVCYVPNGVHEDKFCTADPGQFRRQYGIEDDERLILCVSRIDFQKNQVLLVKAFAEFAQRFPGYKLVLIGPINVESYAEEIRSTAARLNISDRVLLIPGLQPDDPLLPSAYRATDMFVLPSRMEPFGIVILEAWAAGVPVIASRVGGIPGFTHSDEDVLFFEDNDQEGLLAQMVKLATDKALGKRLVAAGQKAVKQYSWEATVQKLSAIYASLKPPSVLRKDLE